MRLRSAVILTGLVVTAGLLATLGGAGTGLAGPRAIDPFTLTAAPSPAQLGRKVSFTIFLRNAGHTLTHANFEGTATAGATFFDYSASRGTCSPDPVDPSEVDCSFGKLDRGDEVTATFVYINPQPSSGATETTFDATLFTTEQGGDPGNPSEFRPTPNPITVTLEPPSADKVSDVLGRAGGSVGTDSVTATNNASYAVTAPATGAFLPVVLAEVPTDPTVCGAAATPVARPTGDLTLPGFFAPSPLVVVVDVDAKGLSFSKLVGCHDGVVLASCPSAGPIPTVGCLQSKQRLRIAGVQVFRLTMLGPINGRWGPGG